MPVDVKKRISVSDVPSMDARNMQMGVNRPFLSMLGKKVTENHVKDLCTKKKTSVIKGMKPKAKEKSL